jgi:hypothetical protein
MFDLETLKLLSPLIPLVLAIIFFILFVKARASSGDQQLTPAQKDVIVKKEKIWLILGCLSVFITSIWYYAINMYIPGEKKKNV